MLYWHEDDEDAVGLGNLDASQPIVDDPADAYERTWNRGGQAEPRRDRRDATQQSSLAFYADDDDEMDDDEASLHAEYHAEIFHDLYSVCEEHATAYAGAILSDLPEDVLELVGKLTDALALAIEEASGYTPTNRSATPRTPVTSSATAAPPTEHVVPLGSLGGAALPKPQRRASPPTESPARSLDAYSHDIWD